MINDFLNTQKNNKIKTHAQTENQLNKEIIHNQQLKRKIIDLETTLKSQTDAINELDTLKNIINKYEVNDKLDTINKLTTDNYIITNQLKALQSKFDKLNDIFNEEQLTKQKYIDETQSLKYTIDNLHKMNENEKQKTNKLKSILDEKNIYENNLKKENSDLNKNNGLINDINKHLINENKQLIDSNGTLMDENKQLLKSNRILLDEKQVLIDENKKLMKSIISLQNDLQNENTIVSCKCPTIYMVYQYKYNNNFKVTGFGDFLRGMYYLLQFSEKYGFKVDFIINEHPIKNYLKYFENKENIDKNISKNICFFRSTNHNYYTNRGIINYNYVDVDFDLFKFIESTNKYNKNKYLYLINHPDEKYINQYYRQRVLEMIEPTTQITCLVNKSMTDLELINRGFQVIHLRLDDNCFYNNFVSLNGLLIDNILNKIKNIIDNTNQQIFLLASSNLIKNIITNKYPNIKCLMNDITHICDKKINNDDNIINTLVDFYIMSNASFIYSFSVYHHGSGFSKWCAVTYNIPYVCFQI